MRKPTRVRAALFLAAMPAGLLAQSGNGVIAGVVKRSMDSIAVAMADVTLDSASTTIATDSSGAFTIRGVAPGAHQVHVRKVGYESTVASAIVSGDRPTQVIVLLQPAAQTLTTVKVSGRTIELPSRYAGIAERANRNHAALFTAKDFAEEFTDRTKDVLQRLPGVNVNDRSVTFARCQDTGKLPSMFGGTGSGTARVQVYVDGVRQAQSIAGNVNDVLNSIHPASIELMEVYTGIGRIPAEFVNDACAVIAIWTKAY